jgi:hypothetical protein
MTWYSLDINTTWIIAPGVVEGMFRNDFCSAIGPRVSDAALWHIGGEHLQSRPDSGRLSCRRYRRDGTHPHWPVELAGAGCRCRSGQPRAMEVFRQSTLLGFIEAFGFVTLAFLLLVPLVWILKRTTVPVRLQ